MPRLGLKKFREKHVAAIDFKDGRILFRIDPNTLPRQQQRRLRRAIENSPDMKRHRRRLQRRGL